MAIPFDGRWQNGTHFRAKRVMDCRPRPDFSPELGFSSWKRHEVEYQMDNARELGYDGPIPRMSFHSLAYWDDEDEEKVYLGFGFKRDAASFWSVKHWGNDRYVQFIRRCREIRPSIKFRATGNAADLAQCIIPISREVGDLGPVTANITSAIEVVGRCAAYFGNDTGMMHVAASFEMPTYGLMAYENVATKNRPWCTQWRVHEFFRGDSDPNAVAEEFVKFVWEE
jgi:ADP-heptose:LPS heptosyltransferase